MSATTGPATTSRVTLQAGGMKITQCTSFALHRDLQEVAGAFEITLFDEARVDQASTATTWAVSYGGVGGNAQPITEGMACQVMIDGELVLDGSIDKVQTTWTADTLTSVISGRDRTGDLVDCAAAPNGPAEFKGVDLLAVATTLCKPFGITPTADVPVGDPFTRLALSPHDTVMGALEKAARQRSILLVSDGIGGLVLTQGGSSRAPAPLAIGDNIQHATCTRSWEHRFSDYYVKGQTEKAGGARAGIPVALNSDVRPLTSGPPLPAPPITNEAAALIMTGHAIDPQITRYRPTVRMSKTQSGMSSVQEQAEWALRVARGEGDQLEYTVLDWRTPEGRSGTLWRPNQVSAVFDPFALINQDMLIAGVRFLFDAQGLRTVLRVVGVTAYDRINEAAKRRPRTQPKRGPLDSTVVPLTAP